MFGYRVVASVRIAGVALAVAALSGCGLLPSLPAATFDLAAPARISVSGSTSAQILVPESTSLQILDSERVVVANAGRISYYPGLQLPDTLPRVIQARTIEAFEDSGRANAAGRPGQGLSIDYQLLTDIRRFQYNPTTGRAEVEVFAQIMDDRNGRIVATRSFSRSTPVTADTADGVVAGLNAAFQALLVDLVAWTVARI